MSAKKPHGRDCPDKCSMCRSDAVVRRVDQADGLIKIDGVPARPIDVEASSAAAYYGKRGKAASSRVTRSKKT